LLIEYLSCVMMKTLNFIFLITLFFGSIGFAQTSELNRQNALSLEIGKSGLIYNLNFDHRFKDNNFGYSLRAGSNFNKYLKATDFTLGGYFLNGITKNFLELGLDLGYLSVHEVSDDQKRGSLLFPNHTIETFTMNFNIGYRKYGKHDLFRVGLSPGLYKEGFLPGAYISYGVSF
jgi:hypothetical protein